MDKTYFELERVLILTSWQCVILTSLNWTLNVGRGKNNGGLVEELLRLSMTEQDPSGSDRGHEGTDLVNF